VHAREREHRSSEIPRPEDYTADANDLVMMLKSALQDLGSLKANTADAGREAGWITEKSKHD
jgi:hypothetical protein